MSSLPFSNAISPTISSTLLKKLFTFDLVSRSTFSPLLLSKYVLFTVKHLEYIKGIIYKENNPPASKFTLVTIFPLKTPPQKCPATNFPIIQTHSIGAILNRPYSPNLQELKWKLGLRCIIVELLTIAFLLDI